MGKTSLVLVAFGIISVLLTAGAAWLAMDRPDFERLDVETRSRLAADYSVDSVARRIQPLDPDIVRAAAEDETALTREQPVTTAPRRVEPADVTPAATAMPTSTPRPSPTARGTATGTPLPGSTPTPRPGAPTATAGPSATPGASMTPNPTATKPLPTLPVPTIALPAATLPVLPTLIPTLPLPTWTPVPTQTPVPTSTSVPTSTPTPTPTSIIGGILDALSCTLLGTIGSLPGGAQTSITFENESGQTVRVYELPVLILGQPMLRATIADGDDYTRVTQVGRAFKVTDMDNSGPGNEGKCLAVYVAQAGGGTAYID